MTTAADEVQRLIARTPGGDLMFFGESYIWCFQKQVNVYGDVLAWRTQKQVPLYVTRYVEYLNGLDSEGAHGL